MTKEGVCGNINELSLGSGELLKTRKASKINGHGHERESA